MVICCYWGCNVLKNGRRREFDCDWLTDIMEASGVSRNTIRDLVVELCIVLGPSWPLSVKNVEGGCVGSA